jgi:hypothetical protein
VRLGPRQHLVDGEGLAEGLLVDPALLVDALALDHRDLRRGATPGEEPEVQETSEDRERRVRHRAQSDGPRAIRSEVLQQTAIKTPRVDRA